MILMDDTAFVASLRSSFNSGENLRYIFFWGHQIGKAGITASCFSQWYRAPFIIEGLRFPTAEHFMMAEKASLFGDQESREKILQAPDPRGAKALGRQVRGFDEAVWIRHRFPIALRANRAKFAQNPALGQFLQESGKRVLVEASPVDRVWGVGLAQDDKRITNPNLWRGLNLLGFALMQVRDDG